MFLNICRDGLHCVYLPRGHDTCALMTPNIPLVNRKFLTLGKKEITVLSILLMNGHSRVD